MSGELGYSGPTSLDRRVLQPYREHTTIRGESVRVEREGEPARSFALSARPSCAACSEASARCSAAMRLPFRTASTSCSQTKEQRLAHRHLRRAIAGCSADGCRQIVVDGRGERAALLHDRQRRQRCERDAVRDAAQNRHRLPDVTLSGCQERCVPGLGARGSGRGPDEKAPFFRFRPESRAPSPEPSSMNRGPRALALLVAVDRDARLARLVRAAPARARYRPAPVSAQPDDARAATAARGNRRRPGIARARRRHRGAPRRTNSPMLRASSRAACAKASEFRFVTNGEMSLDAVPESLLAYRYLLVADARYACARRRLPQDAD